MTHTSHSAAPTCCAPAAPRCRPAIAATYDFGQHKTVVDVGGGEGLLVSTILRHYPGTYVRTHVGAVRSMPPAAWWASVECLGRNMDQSIEDLDSHAHAHVCARTVPVR